MIDTPNIHIYLSNGNSQDRNYKQKSQDLSQSWDAGSISISRCVYVPNPK